METRYGGNGRGTLHEDLWHSRSTSAMLPTMHKQGYIGDLHEKSKVELMELLERQKHLLENRKFVSCLPDYGERIRNFVKKLEDQILIREAEEKSVEEINHAITVVKREPADNQTLPEPPELEQKHEAELKIIERGFEQLSVHEGPHYKVVVKADERNQKKSKFALNRPQRRESKESNSEVRNEAKPHISSSELTSASVHDPDHGPATLISVEEARDLYSTRLQKAQESRADQLADRLLRRMNVEVKGRTKNEKMSDDREDTINLEDDFLDSVD